MRLTHSLLAVGVAAGLSVTVASQAQAQALATGYARCPANRMCVFAGRDGTGVIGIYTTGDVNLGDNVGKGPRGQAVVDRCREVCEVNILGNWDDLLPDPDRAFRRFAF